MICAVCHAKCPDARCNNRTLPAIRLVNAAQPHDLAKTLGQRHDNLARCQPTFVSLGNPVIRYLAPH